MRQSRKYTLVEMLVVIAVAAVIVSLGVPAVSKMLKGNAVDNAASKFKSMVEQAQITAQGRRKTVALLMDVDGARANASAGVISQTFRLCFVKSEGNNYKFVSWVPGSSWQDLGEGAVLTYAGASDSEGPSETVADCSDMPEVINVDNDTAVKYPAVIFSSFGYVKGIDDPRYFVVAEGILADSNGNIQYTSADGGTNYNFVRLELNRFTGQMEYYND